MRKNGGYHRADGIEMEVDILYFFAASIQQRADYVDENNNSQFNSSVW